LEATAALLKIRLSFVAIGDDASIIENALKAREQSIHQKVPEG
jgi:hypothetical protein